MRAARYHGREDVRIEDIDVPAVGPGEVRVEVDACGICGSDLHEYVAGPLTIPSDSHPVTGESVPLTIGHELTGTVREVGDGVEMTPGTDVVINPIIWCGECRYCKEGNYHLCESGGFIGLSGWGGGFAEHLVVPAETAVPLPAGVPQEYAALVEPFTVGVHAVNRSEVGSGDSAVVFGAGPIGLTVLQAAQAAGAGPLFVVEPRDARRERATQCGADTVIDPSASDPVEAIAAATDGGVDVAFEVAGVEQSVNQSLAVTKRGGTITVVSLFEEKIPTDLFHLVTAEQSLVGTAAFLGGPLADREFTTTIHYFEDGTFDPAPLVTSRIGLDDLVDEGFERLLDEESDEVKILVSP